MDNLLKPRHFFSTLMSSTHSQKQCKKTSIGSSKWILCMIWEHIFHWCLPQLSFIAPNDKLEEIRLKGDQCFNCENLTGFLQIPNLTLAEKHLHNLFHWSGMYSVAMAFKQSIPVWQEWEGVGVWGDEELGLGHRRSCSVKFSLHLILLFNIFIKCCIYSSLFIQVYTTTLLLWWYFNLKYYSKANQHTLTMVTEQIIRWAWNTLENKTFKERYHTISILELWNYFTNRVSFFFNPI